MSLRVGDSDIMVKSFSTIELLRRKPFNVTGSSLAIVSAVRVIKERTEVIIVFFFMTRFLIFQSWNEKRVCKNDRLKKVLTDLNEIVFAK